MKILMTLAAILGAALPGVGGTFTSVPNIHVAATMSQATGLNNLGSSSGIFVDDAGTRGFPTEGTIFASPAAFTQALGANSENEAIGFYNDSLGNANGLSSWIITGLGVLAIGLLIRRSAR